jgi:hypothetical protein
LFGFCITHILNTGCAKILKKIRRQKVKIIEKEVGESPDCDWIYAKQKEMIWWTCDKYQKWT